MARANVTVENEHFRLQTQVTVPVGSVRVSDLLPAARALSDAIVRVTCNAVEEAGETISCKKGCGACCRQLVAISEAEARYLRVLVENLPEPRRTEIRARFAAARTRLEHAGLLSKLQQPERWTEEDYTRLVNVYVQHGVACPFLEDESCSIYAERPITCREYLVTSPPEHCATVASENVQRVPLPMRVFNAVARLQVAPSEGFLERWVPLIVAPEWAEAHPNEPPPQPVVELLRELLRHLSGKRKPEGPTS